jgi:iron complex transport system permease protein
MPPLRLLSLLAVTVVCAAALGLLAGHGDLGDAAARAVYLELRGVRILVAGLAGAALAVAGVLMQGLFRNPLASPSVLGTTAGAALGGQLVLMLHGAIAASLPAWVAPEMALPVGCLLGAGAALAILLAVIRRTLAQGGDTLVIVLLVGFILASALASVAAFVTWLGQERWELGRAMVAFTLGGVDGKGLRHAALAVPLVLGGIVAGWLWGRSLDLLLAGEDEAAALGVDVPAARRWILAWTAILTGAATAIGGGVAFVGLIVPHLLRPFAGVEHRRLIPAAALGGAAFLIACDALCRVTPGAELPLGVVTGLIGAPVFAWLLIRAGREGWV